MADRGSIAVTFEDYENLQQFFSPPVTGAQTFAEDAVLLSDAANLTPGVFSPSTFSKIILDNGVLVELTRNATIHSGEGWTSAPSLSMSSPGIFKARLPIKSGNRQIFVGVKQDDPILPRPIFRVKKNIAIGIPSDISMTAPTSSAWVKIGPISISGVSANGVLIVELEVTAPSLVNPCLWDDITLT